jgi:hypothetical protein
MFNYGTTKQQLGNVEAMRGYKKLESGTAPIKIVTESGIFYKKPTGFSYKF